MRTPRPALFDPKPAQPPAALPAATGGTVEIAPAAQPASGKGRKATVKTSLYLDPAVHDKLREIAFQERRKLHDLIVEGVDHVLKTRLHPSSSEIAGKA